MYASTHLKAIVLFHMLFVCLARRSLFGPGGMPCVVPWKPEALDCSVLIPLEAWNRFDRNPPSVGLEPQTTCS